MRGLTQEEQATNFVTWQHIYEVQKRVAKVAVLLQERMLTTVPLITGESK
jgi:hypothetical protein